MTTLVSRVFFNSHTYGSQLSLGAAQLLAHLSLLYVLFSFSLPLFYFSLFIYFLMTSIGVSITAHRYLSHKSFKLPRYFEILGSLFFSLSLQGSTIAWVAMHREHHRFSDRENDPHCPHGHFFTTHFLSMFYTPKIKYVIDLIRDPFHEKIHRYYWPVNIGYSLVLFALLGFKGIVYGHLFPAFLCWQAIGIAKTFSHMFGYRNFKTGDTSYNLPILGYITFGEAWHNNHHAKPGEYSFQSRFHEIDPSALIIKFGFVFLGFKKKPA